MIISSITKSRLLDAQLMCFFFVCVLNSVHEIGILRAPKRIWSLDLPLKAVKAGDLTPLYLRKFYPEAICLLCLKPQLPGQFPVPARLSPFRFP